MKKIFLIIAFTMAFSTLFAQSGEGYDPENPGDPNPSYRLQLEASPKNGGAVNTNSTQVMAGQTYYCSASPKLGFEFKHWMMGDSVVSTKNNFYFAMPAENVKLIAYFTYNPINPGDPSIDGYSHNVNVYANPSVGGYFNNNNFTMTEGDKVEVYAYPNSNFRFASWKHNGVIISTSNPLEITMEDTDIAYTATFVYDPQNPGNPSANSFNPATGELIMDDFEPGCLNSAIEKTLHNYSYYDVNSVVVEGEMESYDFGFSYYMSNCSMIDLARTTGYTKIPEWSFSEMPALTKIILPSSVTEIGTEAFYGCSFLSELWCYATEPPVLNEMAFGESIEGLVIRVPSSAVALYTQADVWKDHTILPLDQEVCKLTVNLPEDAEDGRYKNMIIDVKNVSNGQTIRYIITDKISYSFSNLIGNSTYNVFIKNTSGAMLGCIYDILLNEEEQDVSFESLLQPENVTINVLTPDGNDVTSQTTISWFDKDDRYITQGATLKGILENTKLTYNVDLPKELAMQYILPNKTGYTVKSSDNNIVIELVPFEEVVISGYVRDKASGSAISNASVSISQTLNGKYSKSIVVTTDNSGKFSATIYKTSCKVVAAATDYLSNTISVDNVENTDVLDNIQLKAMTGVRINTLFTYTETVAEGETANTQNYYSDYANVSYSVYNKTKKHEIENLNIQYPYIILLGIVEPGDVLTVTASSRNNMFMDTAADCVVDENDYATVTLPIVELGELQASYNYSETSDVVAILYDAKGQLMKKSKYSGKSVTFSNLKDGNYSLVSMKNSDLLSSILNISKLSSVGLYEGKHYIKNDITVQSGLISVVSINEIYDFDESEFYYTGDNTQFTVNKQSVTVGNYVTLRAKVDFKSKYANSISDVKLIFDLPESCEFVANSVMAGNTVSSYAIGENRVEVEMTSISDLVRFCIIPIESGTCTPNAMVQFKYNGEEILQPIGRVTFDAKNMEINVPSFTASKEIAVSGICKELSLVEIYDNDVLVANTTALANGNWSVNCTLNNAYNLSRHNIYAIVTTRTGALLQSETKEVLYDMNAVQISKVTMYHWNPEVNKMYEIVYDFINPSLEEQNYIYYIYNKEFTFTIEFTINDPDLISNVILYVETGKGRHVPLEATFDTNKNLWVASGEFGNTYDGDVPINVSVDFDTDTKCKMDRNLIDEFLDSGEDFHILLEGEYRLTDSVADKLLLLLEEHDLNTNETDMLSAELLDICDITIQPNINDDDVSIADLLLKSDSLLFGENCNTLIDGILELSIDNFNEISQYLPNIVIDTCYYINESDLINEGYELIELTDGSCMYYKSSDVEYTLIDNVTGIIIKYQFDESILFNRDGLESYLENVIFLCEKLLAVVNTVANAVDNVINQVDALAEKCTKQISENMGKIIAHGEEPFLSDDEYKALVKKNVQLSKQYKSCKSISNWLVKNLKNFRIGNGVGVIYSLYDIYDITNNIKSDGNEIIDLYYSVPYCEDSESNITADNLRNSIRNWGIGCLIYYSGKLTADIIQINAVVSGVTGAIPTGGTSLSAVGIALGIWGLNIAAEYFYDKQFEANKSIYWDKVNNFKCKDDDDDDNDDDNDGGKHKSGNPDTKYALDPSGFVYEGVSSNRIEGVMASCYYKEFVEDMYGDITEKVVLWDAEAYAQENPLFTDENGMYRWDVPQGLWQVKFEKEGYQTTYSDWLPVPPPQLEVNIPITQNTQPNVTSACAYQNAIEVQFDKYMMPAYLTTDNIIVTVDGYAVSGTIELLDEEVCYEGMSNKFASKVRFNADEPFQAEEVTLTVKNSVRSYANIRMQDDFSQSFTVEVEIQKIVCAPTLQVNYNEETEIVVSVIPAVASKGKTLNVVSQAPIILSVDTTSYIINEEGQVKINVKGELPGSASLLFSVEGYDINAQSLVKVEQKQVYESKQTTTLNEGWNWYSTYLEINGKDGLTRLQNSMNGKAEQIKSQMAFSSYESGNWFGLLENARTEDMYMIKMSEDTEINLSGNIADPSEHPITLNQNWTWFGYILNENMSLKEGLVNFTPNDGDYIKSQSGFNTYYNGNWYGEIILDFEVGKGYMYKNTSDVAKTLVYPKVSSKGRQIRKIRKTSSEKYWTTDINKYPTNMSIIAAVNMDGEEMSEYEIGAFCNGECRGSARPVYIEELDRYMIFLSVNGDDNDEISFRYYDVAANEEYEYDAAERIDYYANGTLGTMTEPYIFNFGSMSIDDYTHYSLEIYPNPVDKNNEIHLGTICERVEVYNSLGVMIADYKNVGTIEGIDIPGVYIINAVNKNNVKYCRLIVK